MASRRIAAAPASAPPRALHGSASDPVCGSAPMSPLHRFGGMGAGLPSGGGSPSRPQQQIQRRLSDPKEEDDDADAAAPPPMRASMFRDRDLTAPESPYASDHEA